VGENSLLEQVTAAAEERQLSQNTLTVYRRTWLKSIAWAAAEGLALETLPEERAGSFMRRLAAEVEGFAARRTLGLIKPA
jgi:site-specific recombinase XerD